MGQRERLSLHSTTTMSLSDGPLPPFSDHVYSVKSGVELLLRIFHAPDSSSATPYIVLLHGGAYTSGQHFRPYPWWITGTQQANIALISVAYRLSPRVDYDAMVTDCQEACRFVRGLANTPALRVDPDNFVVAGSSAGGSLALSLATRLHPPPRGVMAFYAPTDFTDPDLYTPRPDVAWHPSGLSGLYNLEELERASTDHDSRKALVFAPGKHDQSEQELRALWKTDRVSLTPESKLQTDLMLYGGWRMSWLSMALQKSRVPDEVAWRIRQESQSPLSAFTEAFPPTVFVHGTADELLSAGQTKRAADRLNTLGVRTTAWFPTGKKHAFDRRIQLGTTGNMLTMIDLVAGGHGLADCAAGFRFCESLSTPTERVACASLLYTIIHSPRPRGG
jgi:acetyl esterase/lipase